MTDHTLYKVNTSWRNQQIALIPGRVVELTPDQAREILTDVPDGISPLDSGTGKAITTGIARLEDRLGVKLCLDWRPDPAQPTPSTGGGPVMTAGSMPGLTAA